MSQQKTNAFGGVLGASHGDAQRRVKFSFDVNDAIYSRDGEDNLIIEQGDSHLVFNDFFVTDGKELPEIELLDGTIVDGATLEISMPAFIRMVPGSLDSKLLANAAAALNPFSMVMPRSPSPIALSSSIRYDFCSTIESAMV